MSKPIFFAMPGNDTMAFRLAQICGGETGTLESRNFPDGETYLRFHESLDGRDAVLICTMDRPDAKIAPLLFAAAGARELGARRIGLVAPYLCYMRQDRRFHAGELVTSRSFAAMVSSAFDWLATVDPHLHRYKQLNDIYTIPTATRHAGSAIAAWIKTHIDRPFLVGPDRESEQWVAGVAKACGAGYGILHKTRQGDRHVQIEAGALHVPPESTPVLLDDIASSGETMLAALRLLRPLVSAAPVAIAIHGLFEPSLPAAIRAAGAQLVVTDTVLRSESRIEIGPLLAEAVMELLP